MTTRATLTTAAATGVLVAAAVAWALAARIDTRAAVAAARFVLDAAAVAGVAVALVAWLGQDTPPTGSARGARGPAGGASRGAGVSLRRAAVVVAAVWVAAAVVLAWLAAADVAGVSPARVGIGTVADYVTTFAAGTAVAVSAVFAVGYAVVALTRSDALRPAPELLAVIAVAGLLPGPLAGHAASGPRHELTILSVALHAAAAAVWVGGVAALVVLAAGRRRLDAAVARFARLAGPAVLVVAVSGVVTALARLGSVTALATTGYGVVVLGKTAVLIALVLVAARVRRATRAPVPLIAGELALMAVALGLAAALTGAAT